MNSSASLQYIKTRLQQPENSISATLALLEQDCTIPFIARYRKEKTNNLDEVAIASIVKLKREFDQLEQRKKSILKSLEEQGQLHDDLRINITQAADLTQLEDLYLPYKKKRKTKAETARNNGLEPLAKMVMSQNVKDLEDLALRYVNDTVSSSEEALAGARHIIAEWINERSAIRDQLRQQISRHAMLETKVVSAKKENEKAQKYTDYFNWSEPLHRCPSHRLLAILRAENEGFIKVKITLDDHRALTKIEDRIIRSNNACATQLEMAIADAYKRLLIPALTNEVMKAAKEKADEAAISVFAKNLKQLLLGAPLGEKTILALDPGFRSGCKLVCLSAQGDLLHNETIYPHAPQNDKHGAMKKITSLIDAYKIEAIAIGNGTASRETEALIRGMRFSKEVHVFVVNEAGASIYSASKIARDEFPNYDVTVRGAVSIGRRLADPLAELVKIDPKSIGVGQYQHDVDQTKLKHELDQTVASCVNTIGVNINTASESLLSYVSGIGPKLASNIVRYRQEHGAFSDRNQIKKVPRLGDKAFEQGAGFLRIKQAKNPLDDSAVHPERYALVAEMAKNEGVAVADLIGNKTVLQKIDLTQYCTKDVGILTLTDIIAELEKPGVDPREQAKVFTFNQNLKTIHDVKPGQRLPGIVNNVTNFGCFVDIGIKESGLVHISNLADTYVKDVTDHVSLHQQVIVKVLEVDPIRKRIQLSMKSN